MGDDTDAKLYRVIRDGEGHFEIQPVEEAVPAGWEKTGFEDTKERVLAHVERQTGGSGQEGDEPEGEQGEAEG